jgi:hypothetical protein
VFSLKEENMSKRTLGIILIVLGVIGAVVLLAADALGIGAYPGLNWVQLLGGAICLLVGLAGIWLAFSKTDIKK